jgi:hypothetical protein
LLRPIRNEPNCEITPSPISIFLGNSIECVGLDIKHKAQGIAFICLP